MLKFITSSSGSIKISATNQSINRTLKRAVQKCDPESGGRNKVRCAGTHDHLNPSSSRT